MALKHPFGIPGLGLKIKGSELAVVRGND